MNEGRGHWRRPALFRRFQWLGAPTRLVFRPAPGQSRISQSVSRARLQEICEHDFTGKMVPLINAMEKRLELEIPIRACLAGTGPREQLGVFYNDIQSLRNQVKYRRQFILEQIPQDRAAR